MFTVAALREIHTRTHESAKKYLAHLASLPTDELHREHDGFGGASIARMLHHVFGAEFYWVGVLRAEMRVDENEAEWESLDALEAFRARVFADTEDYFDGVSDDDLNKPTPVTTWGDKQEELLPALIVIRTQTHAFQHFGQIAPLCRMAGHPVPSGLDFPVR